MVNNRNAFRSIRAVLWRKKVACNELNISSGIELGKRVVKASKVARGSNKAAEIGKVVVEQLLDHFRADKTIGPGD